jgi:hypothetical protein
VLDTDRYAIVRQAFPAGVLAALERLNLHD